MKKFRDAVKMFTTCKLYKMLCRKWVGTVDFDKKEPVPAELKNEKRQAVIFFTACRFFLQRRIEH